LADPAAHLIVAEHGGETVGMALAEPFREANGVGDMRAGWGHVSMLFVRPDHQGVGVGRELVQRLVHDAPWSHLSVWTRESNWRAQRLYQGCGFVATSEPGVIRGGEPIQRWERRDLGQG
jgi:GNAT superfamily N-acetyltransferase